MGAGDQRGRAIDVLVDTALDQVDLAGFHDRVITTLSGGEQQRAHFARILVQLACGEAAHGPGVLLLDEPTASLDAQTEFDLLSRYAEASRAMSRRTGAVTVLVSHRFSTVRSADLIVVLDGGRVVESGTHNELVARGGLYAKLYELQAKAYR
jgi:ABC-type multidrug transport system fused ATPase/permease subunit